MELYKSGGLLSVTSRILVVDMLTKIIPVDLISGVVVLHAETCVSLVLCVPGERLNLLSIAASLRNPARPSSFASIAS